MNDRGELYATTEDVPREDAERLEAWADAIGKEQAEIGLYTDPPLSYEERAQLEAAFEAEGIKLRRCECGTAEVKERPNSDVGFVCAGCGRDI